MAIFDDLLYRKRSEPKRWARMSAVAKLNAMRDSILYDPLPGQSLATPKENARFARFANAVLRQHGLAPREEDARILRHLQAIGYTLPDDIARQLEEEEIDDIRRRAGIVNR